jgi:hypothetical protein
VPNTSHSGTSVVRLCSVSNGLKIKLYFIVKN